MKRLIFFAILFCSTFITLLAQNKITYPDPEFSNEITYLVKDSVRSLVRLEKASSKAETNVKAAGFGGMENGYVIRGERSNVRLKAGRDHSFIFSTGESATKSSSAADSMMRANGMNPSMIQSMGSMNDPANTINLYKVEKEKGERKILMMKSGGMMSMSKKSKSSDKFTFSVRKIREGYWELVIDKPLPKGEYAFTMSGGMNMSMDGSVTLYAFGID
jgi:hypothetical protein